MTELESLLSDTCPVSSVGEARRLARDTGNDVRVWWAKATQGDWLIWCAGQMGVALPPLVLASCACARIVLPLLADGENRPLNAINLGEAWARGNAAATDCAKFADALYADCDLSEAFGGGRLAAAAMNVVGAAEAALNAAGQSRDRNLSITLATNAARRAAVAMKHAKDDEAMRKAHLECAEIVRQIIEMPRGH